MKNSANKFHKGKSDYFLEKHSKHRKVQKIGIAPYLLNKLIF